MYINLDVYKLDDNKFMSDESPAELVLYLYDYIMCIAPSTFEKCKK